MNFNYISCTRAEPNYWTRAWWPASHQQFRKMNGQKLLFHCIQFHSLLFSFLHRFRLGVTTLMTISNSLYGSSPNVCAHLFDWHFNFHTCARVLLELTVVFFSSSFPNGQWPHENHLFISSHVPNAHCPNAHTAQVLLSCQIKNRIQFLFSQYFWLARSLATFGQIGNFVLIFHLHALARNKNKQLC